MSISQYKPFTAFQLLDSMFRDKPEGAKFRAETMQEATGTTTIHWGIYVKTGNGSYDLDSGKPVIRWDGAKPEAAIYPDMIAGSDNIDDLTFQFYSFSKTDGRPF